MRTRSRSGFTLVELLTVIAIIGILVGVIFPAVAGVQKKSVIASSQAAFSQWAAGCNRFKQAYGFYPNIGTTYNTTSDSLFKLETAPNCVNFIKSLYGKSPLGVPLSAGATGDRAKYNRNAEEFCAFGQDDYESYATMTDVNAQLNDRFGNHNIRVIFDTDGTGNIKQISTPLPNDLASVGTTVGLPARVIIFTTVNDVGSLNSTLSPSDAADIYAIQ
jgi:prepilin-type N-terminal cleavage/methylation domain-containing protein